MLETKYKAVDFFLGIWYAFPKGGGYIMDNNEKLDIIIAKLDEALKIDNEKEMIAIRVTILENELRRVKERVEQIA